MTQWEQFYRLCLRIHTVILDCLFPVACLGCGTPDTWICISCLNRLLTNRIQVCPWCEKTETPNGELCFACRHHCPLDNLLVATSYQEPLIAHAIHAYKYRFVSDLKIPLGTLILNTFNHSALPLPDVITAIPLHSRRLRWRGFNQAELLATFLARELAPPLAIPVLPLLARIHAKKPQAEVKEYAKRQQNALGLFALRQPLPTFSLLNNSARPLAGLHILLIDDVATTGATLFECARILKANGAQKVTGAVVARQGWSKG